MSAGRSFVTYFKSDASGFTKGVNEMQDKLKGLNTALKNNQKEQKEASKNITSAEKEIEKINKQIEKNGKATEEQEKQLAQLNQRIKDEKERIEGLKLAQGQLLRQIDETNAKIREQKQALQNLEKSLEDTKKYATEVATEFGAMGAAAVAAVAALYQFTSKAALWADDLNTLSTVTGISTDELQKFAYASDLIDVSIDTLSGALTKLMKNMQTASENTKSTAAKAFKELGISVEDSSGKLRDRQEVFFETISALGKIADETERDVMAMNLFGKSAQELNPFIQGGAETLKKLGDEAERAGLILDETALTQLNDINDKIDILKAKGNAIEKLAATQLTPTIDGLLDVANEFLNEVNEMVQSGELEKYAKDIGELIKNAANNLKNVIEWCWKYKDVISAVVVAMTAFKVAMSIANLVNSLVMGFKALTVVTEEETIKMAALNTVIQTNPYGILFALVTSLIAGFTTLNAITNATANSFDNANVKIKNYLENLENLQAEADKRIEDVQNESKVLKDLQKEYDDLRQKINPTIEDKSRLDTIAGQLANTLGISTQALKDKNDAYIDITGSVNEYIKKLEEQARLENATNGLKEAYIAYDKAKKSCQDYNKEVEKQQEIVDDAEKHYQNLKKAVGDYIKENHANPYKYQTAEYDKLSSAEKAAKEEYENQQTALENLKVTRAAYQIQMQSAMQSEIEYKKALGQVVDEEKEWEQCGYDMNVIAEETNNTLSKLNNSETELSETTETATKKTETLSEKYERLNNLLEENEQAIKDVNDEIEQAMDSGDTAHIEELQSKLKDLNSENTTLKNRIKAVKDEIEKDTNAIADAIENVENSMQMLQKAEKEVADNGKLSLNTLMSIQKKYPELLDLVNDYVSGVKTEKDVIAGLKDVYEKDVESYNQALAFKKLKQDSYNNEFANASAELINKYQEHYGIDLKNFMNVTEAKLAAQKRLQQAFDEAQQKRNDFQSNYMVFNNAYGTQYMKKDSNGNWKTATAAEIAEYKRQMQELNNVFDKAFLDMEHFDETAFQKQLEEDIARLYKPVNADGLFNLSGSSSSNSGSGKNDGDKKDIFTKSGYGVTATGDTYAKAYMTWVDRLKSLGKITAKGEIFWLEKLKERTDNTAEEIYQIDLKLYQARQKLADDSAKSLADIEKKRQDELQEKLNLAKAAYDRLINGRVESLQKEAQAAKDTANAEIAALDKVLAKRKQAKADEERQKKIDFINTQLRYKQLDEFSRNELQRQKQDLLNEQAEIEFERNISAQQQAISARSDLAQNKTQQAIDGLNSAKSQFADHIAYLSGSQSYDQRIANNTTNQNVQIIQNGLNGDQVVSKLMKALGVS